MAERTHPITVTARHIEHEFYWEEKCKEHKNLKKHDHGGSHK